MCEVTGEGEEHDRHYRTVIPLSPQGHSTSSHPAPAVERSSLTAVCSGVHAARSRLGPRLFSDG